MAASVPIARKLADDRGRVVEIRRRDRDVTGSAPRWQRRIVLGALPLLAGVFWWYPLRLIQARYLPYDAAAWVVIALGLGACVAFVTALGMIWWMHWPAHASKRIAAWRTGQGYCGACAYPLKDLVNAADDCVVCPECGAAWNRRHSHPQERMGTLL